MRLKHLIAAAAAAMLAASGASALAATTVSTGQADLHYAYSSFDPGSRNSNIYGVDGAYATPLSDRWGLEVNGAWNHIDPDHGGGRDNFSGTAHVFYRTEQNLIGGEAGFINDARPSRTAWGVGLEDDYYLKDVTLGGRAVFLDDDKFASKFYGVEGHGRYFAQDNLALTGSLGVGRVENNPHSATAWQAGINGEYQFASSPISVFAGVNYVEADASPTVHATSGTIGVRWNFGGQTLKDRDRSGPSLVGINNAFAGLGSIF